MQGLRVLGLVATYCVRPDSIHSWVVAVARNPFTCVSSISFMEIQSLRTFALGTILYALGNEAFIWTFGHAEVGVDSYPSSVPRVQRSWKIDGSACAKPRMYSGIFSGRSVELVSQLLHTLNKIYALGMTDDHNLGVSGYPSDASSSSLEALCLEYESLEKLAAIHAL
jgi:hypothetical protein